MKQIIELIDKIERIGNDHPEVYDTDVKESIYRGLIEVINGKSSETNFGMFSVKGNKILSLATKEFGESIKHSETSSNEMIAILDSSEIKSSSGQPLDVFWGSSEATPLKNRESLNYKLTRFLDKPYTFPIIFIIPGLSVIFLLWLLFPVIFQYEAGKIAALILAGVCGLFGGAYLYEKIKA